ncbi:unnamed protein product [Chrysoparadoxa australica]
MKPACIEWQPKGRNSPPNSHNLSIGWNDGQIALWNINLSEASNGCVCYCENQSVHRCSITVLRWKAGGNRLITGDKGGQICVWRADSRGNLTATAQYHKGGAISAAVFFSTSTTVTAANILAQASPCFFFGTSNGTVCYADDLGHCSDVAQLTSGIDRLMFYEEEVRVVAITRSLLMTQLQVSPDGHVSQLLKIKLSVKAGAVGERGVKDIVWAGPGLLAAATGEGLVRFWDLVSDTNYVLSLTSAGLQRSDRAVHVAFNNLQRYLAVGTNDGHIAMWKFAGGYHSSYVHWSSQGLSPRPPLPRKQVENGESGAAKPSKRKGRGKSCASAAVPSQGSAADWLSLPAVEAGAPIHMLQWGPGTLSIFFLFPPQTSGTIMLCEEVLHRHLSNGIAVIQLSTNTISSLMALLLTVPVGSLEYENDLAAQERDNVVTCDIKVKGLALEGDTLVIFSGKEAQVFSLKGPGLQPDRKKPFKTQAKAIVVDDQRDQVFCAAGGKIEIFNLSGGFKSALTFTEGEGSPILMDLNGRFLAVATDRGVIKLFDISKKEKKEGLPVRPLGSAGKFVEQETGEVIGAIRSIRCNADGTRVSILSDKVHGKTITILEPDPRLHVYDADKDVVVHYDWGKHGRYPTSHFWDAAEPRLLAVEVQRLRGGSTPKADGAEPATPAATKSPGESKEEAKDEEGKYSDADDANTAAAVAAAARARSEAMVDVDVVETQIATMFVTPTYGILLQDCFPLEYPLVSLLGLQVPRLYFNAAQAQGKGKNQRGETKVAERSEEKQQDTVLMNSCTDRVMRDFVGLEDVDPATTRALLDFSYYLTVGDMDKAYVAVRLIKNTSVWQNMAHMCVKTNRLDVAEVCLGNMGHAR